MELPMLLRDADDGGGDDDNEGVRWGIDNGRCGRVSYYIEDYVT